MGDVIATGVGEDVIGDSPCITRYGDGVAVEPRRKAKRVRNTVTLALAELKTPRSFDVERRPGRMQPVGEPFGVAHQAGRTRVLTNTDQNALSGRPGPLDRASLHLRQQLLIHALRRPS